MHPLRRDPNDPQNGVSMATVQYPRTRSVRRAAIAALLVLACTAGFVLSAQSSPVEASGLFGGLREPGEAFFIAGHRGDRASAPENTMPALQAALDGPMGFIE